MSTKVILNNVRLSYPNLFAPRAANENATPKYSASLIIEKADKKQIGLIKKAITEAVENAKDSKLGGKVKGLRLPLRDGDEDRGDDPAYAGAVFINASSTSKPGVVDQNVQPILDQSDIYPGCYVNVSLNFYAYNVNGNRGVAAGLNNVQKCRDGEPLDGRVRASDEFQVVSYQDDDEADEDNPELTELFN